MERDLYAVLLEIAKLQLKNVELLEEILKEIREGK
jgi:hypothetical protein